MPESFIALQKAHNEQPTPNATARATARTPGGQGRPNANDWRATRGKAGDEIECPNCGRQVEILAFTKDAEPPRVYFICRTCKFEGYARLRKSWSREMESKDLQRAVRQAHTLRQSKNQSKNQSKDSTANLKGRTPS